MKNSEENKTSELLRFIGAIIIGLDISFIPTLVVLLFLGFKTLEKTPESGSLYVFAGIDKARFRKRVGPKDSIDLFSTVVNEKRGIWKFETRAEVDGELASSATIMCADRKV